MQGLVQLSLSKYCFEILKTNRDVNDLDVALLILWEWNWNEFSSLSNFSIDYNYVVTIVSVASAMLKHNPEKYPMQYCNVLEYISFKIKFSRNNLLDLVHETAKPVRLKVQIWWEMSK